MASRAALPSLALALLLALASLAVCAQAGTQKTVVVNAVSPKANLASIMMFTKATSPMFAKVFAKTSECRCFRVCAVL